MTRRAPAPADLGPLSGCAAELAEAFVSLASDIALVIDEDGVIRSVAQGAGMPIAADAGGWVGRPWIDTVSGETRPKVELMLADLRNTGVARRREINVAAGSGSDVPVAFSALRLGAFGPVLAVGRELRAVSAIQQRFLDAQQELERGYWRTRQAESRYRLLFQVATDAVMTVDARSLHVVEANHAAAGALGAGAALAGRPVLDLFDRSSRGALQELLNHAGSSGKPAEVHARMPKTRQRAAVSATPFRTGSGQRLLLRVRAAPAVGSEDLNKTLALLVDRTSDGIVVTDSSGRIVVANPAFLKLVGGGAEEALRGQPIAEWVGRIDDDVAALLQGAHSHGIAHLVRSCVRPLGGAAIDVDVTAAMLAEGEQECFGFTIHPCQARAEPPGALALSLGELDDAVGRVPLAELMARSVRLLEQRFVASAMSRCHGDAAAAAAVLGVAIDKVLACLDSSGSSAGPAVPE